MLTQANRRLDARNGRNRRHEEHSFLRTRTLVTPGQSIRRDGYRILRDAAGGT